MKNTEIKLSYSFLQQCQCYFKFIVNRFIIKSIFFKKGNIRNGWLEGFGVCFGLTTAGRLSTSRGMRDNITKQSVTPALTETFKRCSMCCN